MNMTRQPRGLATAVLLAAFSGCCPSATQSHAATASADTAGEIDATQSRDQIPRQYLWDLSPLFADDAAFEAGLVEAARQRRELAGCTGSLAEPARMRTCLELYFSTRLLTNRLTLHAGLRHATDQESSAAQARVDRGQAAMNELMGIAASLRGEILALGDDALARAYQTEPALEALRPYVEQMRRRREHVLGTEAEHLLSLAGDNQWAEIDLNELPSDHERAFRAFLNQVRLPTVTDESGRAVQLTLSNYATLRGSPDRDVRRQTVEGLFGALRGFDQTFAALLSGQVRQTVFLARSRRYGSALEAYLDRDQVDPAIYRNLVTTIEDNLAPLHRYVRFRRERMGLDELHIYDLYTPIVPVAERQISYEAARRTVAEALAPLGEDYGTVLARGMDPRNGWIDVYPHQGKDSGAFSANVHGTHPFVLMNYFGHLEDMLTLAHEYGHALHSHYATKTQPYVTSNSVPVIAETASTFNEVLVMRHLARNATDDAERLYLLGRLVESIRTTIYRQALLASFELAVHTAVEEGTPVTAEFLTDLYARLLRRYYGEGLTLGPNDGMEWAYIPHLYYKFYVYSYAMGLCSGIALGDRLLAGGAAERDAYLGMLSSGSSRPPIDLLRGAGVDPSRPEVIGAAARLLDQSLTEMEQILARSPQG